MGINGCHAIYRLYLATLMSCGTAKHVSLDCIYIYIYIYIYIFNIIDFNLSDLNFFSKSRVEEVIMTSKKYFISVTTTVYKSFLIKRSLYELLFLLSLVPNCFPCNTEDQLQSKMFMQLETKSSVGKYILYLLY